MNVKICFFFCYGVCFYGPKAVLPITWASYDRFTNVVHPTLKLNSNSNNLKSKKLKMFCFYYMQDLMCKCHTLKIFNYIYTAQSYFQIYIWPCSKNLEVWSNLLYVYIFMIYTYNFSPLYFHKFKIDRFVDIKSLYYLTT